MAKRRRYKSYAWTHPKTKKLYARIQIRQPDGKLKTYLKPAKNATHADQLAAEMFDDYAVRKTGFIDGEVMTFDDLAKWYIETKVQPPVYSDTGIKVSGMRTHRNVRLRIERLQKFLGKMLIKHINEDVLAACKDWLKKESPNAKPASINRYLEDLRAMLRAAVRRRWLRENPFDFGDRMIDTALEARREVILTGEQEFVILEMARRSEKTLLYHALLCLLDTGARPSEIYDASSVKGEPVKWKDFFDYDFQAVKLTSYKGKKKLVRFAPVTERLESAMMELWDSLKESEQKSETQIFPVKSFKTAWGKVRKKSETALRVAAKEKIPVSEVLALSEEKFNELKTEAEKLDFNFDVRLRDLRRNFSTRLANTGMENDLRQRILGHEMAQTTFDYTQADLQTALLAKKMLDRQNKIDLIESDAVN